MDPFVMRPALIGLDAFSIDSEVIYDIMNLPIFGIQYTIYQLAATGFLDQEEIRRVSEDEQNDIYP